MKNFNWRIVLACAAAVISLSACEGDDVKEKEEAKNNLSVTPPTLDFTREGGKRSLAVTTDAAEWTAIRGTDWLRVTEKEGRSFTVEVPVNPTTAARTGQVVVTAGNAERVIVTVEQQAGVEAKVLDVVPGKLDVFAHTDAGTQELVVSTNQDTWTAVPSADWIVIDVPKAEQGDSPTLFTVAALNNELREARVGTVTVTAGEAEPVVIAVEQQAWTPYDWAADPALQTVRAFPGAEGFGGLATGGRGGRVVAVTTLADNAENPPVGGLRWALQQYPGEPLTVVFNVSGIIALNGTGSRGGELRSSRPNLTLAGQTAPGGGICIMGDKVNFGASKNLVVRHLRFRAGDMGGNGSGKGSVGVENAENLIFDHCTFGWSVEENMTMYDNKNTTVQWSIVHEGLYLADHIKGARGYGCQWGGQNATFHHNLLAHNDSRSPRFNGARSNDIDVLIDFVNNVNYNWGRPNSCYGSDMYDDQPRTNRTNFVNNYYKPGPARPVGQRSYFSQSSVAAGAEGSGGGNPNYVAKWHLSGNIMESNADYTANNYNGIDMGSYSAEIRGNTSLWQSAAPFAIPADNQVTTQTAEEAFESVLAGAGAFPRDAVDTRIVGEVRSGTATYIGASNRNPGIIDKPADAGGYPTYSSLEAPADTDADGMPDTWETYYGLDPQEGTDGALSTLSGNAYTNLEVYLYDLVRER